MVRKKGLEAAISEASRHTIKKFELIEEYTEDWAPKLLNYERCDGVVFIDCMCGSGVYRDSAGNAVYGTPVRVAKYFSSIASGYSSKRVWLYFNDLSDEKIKLLNTHLPPGGDNLTIITKSDDGNDLLRAIANEFRKLRSISYLLVYDPYTASVDWTALMPFLRGWGEVILNHMVSDSVRGVSQAKRDVTVSKYEQTYQASIDELVTFDRDRRAYEGRIRKIIVGLRGLERQRLYIASFPFFNTRNVLVYNLIHCSGHIEGFKLFKKTAWKVFGGRSSLKDTHGMEKQLQFNFDGSGELKTSTDEYCYHLSDIAAYLHSEFRGRRDVPLAEVWSALDEHPVFPSEGFREEIKSLLKSMYNDTVSVSNRTITFTNGRS